MKRAALALSLALLVPQAAAARPADCLLIIDAVEYINGRCDFQAIDDDGSFQIMGLNGQFFAQVLIYRKGRGEGWWNGAPYVSRAHSPLGDLRRDDACWINSRVSVCAW